MNTSSQKLKSRHKLNDLISVKVIEQLDERAWIVSLQGVLIQVLNTTTQELQEGEVIQMRLISLDPPRLAWL